ncbi:MAG: endonuclease/exonuclease/phosphatase family protein, partial [Actinomycetota bacterium]
VLGALLVAAVAQVARTLFPAVYLIGEDGSFALAGIAALAIYAAPVLAMALVSLDGRTRLIAGTLLIVVARLAVQFAHPIPPWLAMVATAAVLVGAALAAGADVRRRSALAVTVVLGLALDTALRSPFRSWDLAWQDGAAAVGTTLAAAATAIALLIVARRAPRGGSEEGGAGLRVAALGPYLVLQLLFLQNVGFVGSQGDVGFAAATLVVLVGDALALMALAVAADRPANRAVPAITGTGAALLAFALTLQEGAGSVAVVLALQALGTLCLGWTLEGTARPAGRWSTSVGVAAAALSFLLLALLWQLDIDTPLPFPRAVLPLVAALLLGVGATRGTRTPRSDASSSRPFLALAGAIALVGAGLGGWLWMDRPAEGTTLPLDGELRVVQYNIRGALDPLGRLDPDAVARAIASSDPDVVILQEVARGWPIFGAGDVLARIQQRLDMPYRFEPAADGQFGNAILSRLPMRLVSSGPLPEVPGEQARSFLAVRLDVGARASLLVVAGHLEGDDVAQIEALLDAWGGTSPAIVAGDLNMQPDDVGNVGRFTGAGLVDAEGATGDPCRTTSTEPTSECDRVSWVFLTPDLRILGFRIGTVAASDHLPVHVQIALPG